MYSKTLYFSMDKIPTIPRWNLSSKHPRSKKMKEKPKRIIAPALLSPPHYRHYLILSRHRARASRSIVNHPALRFVIVLVRSEFPKSRSHADDAHVAPFSFMQTAALLIRVYSDLIPSFWNCKILAWNHLSALFRRYTLAQFQCLIK